MRKIPTIFERDWDGDRSRVIASRVGEAAWVFAGEGHATRKLDGTSCLVSEGMLYRRHEVRPGKKTPPDFWEIEYDDMSGKHIGWVPVGDGPEDKWHREAFDREQEHGGLLGGTYELIGPKVQGNPEGAIHHELVAHTSSGLRLEDVKPVPRTFDGLHDFLASVNIEGIVWHHDDGRMAKIKKRDFGLRREKIQP